MSISQKLDLRQGQQLVMTPQLQQAIKLLQLTNLELQEFVEAQLLENPFLERDERDKERQRGEGSESLDAKAANEKDELSFNEKEPSTATKELDTDFESIDPNASFAEKKEYERSEPLVNEWAQTGSGGSHDFSALEGHANLAREKTLHEVLSEQLTVEIADEAQRLIGAVLIDMIDDGGYLRGSTENVALRLGVAEQDVLQVLAKIQQFEPAGVGARDLKECLQLQLQDKKQYNDEMDLFLTHLHLVGAADLAGLQRATRMDQETISRLIAEIRTLTPKPGLKFGSDFVQVVVPDVYVKNGADGGWKVELNSETLPKVLSNQNYFLELSSNCKSEEDVSYLSEQISNANWLVKSLDQRARTILKVSSEIVRQQDAFFVHGIKYLRPLNLKTVADAISMHESTVSRVTSNKFMATPRGVFELKYFFTSAIAATTGTIAHSAESVRHRIKELVDAETARSILSDDKLVEILRKENIDIARRTVAKYREAMNIPSSVVRRRVKQRSV
ncbi:MAG: RNA polymerase factor sigma-54 [bacterium]